MTLPCCFPGLVSAASSPEVSSSCHQATRVGSFAPLGSAGPGSGLLPMLVWVMPRADIIQIKIHFLFMMVLLVFVSFLTDCVFVNGRYAGIARPPVLDWIPGASSRSRLCAASGSSTSRQAGSGTCPQRIGSDASTRLCYGLLSSATDGQNVTLFSRLADGAPRDRLPDLCGQ